jgi:hypothetical protein
MTTSSTFFHAIRWLWVSVNLVALSVSVSGFRDLSPVTLMLSFPASVLAGLIVVTANDALGWNEPTWLIMGLLGIIVTGFGYVQWFVIGDTLARRIISRLPTHRLLSLALRAVPIVLFLGLGAIGIEIVHAQDRTDEFIDRAVTVREGMTREEVLAILGGPKESIELTRGIEDRSLCSVPAVRGALYWYEHHYLPRQLASRRFFTLVVCFDQQGKVIDTSTISGH